MKHTEYIQQLKDELQKIETAKISLYAEEIELCKSINLDSIKNILSSLYAPNSPRKPRDPINMFRSILVMTISQVAGVTEFVDKTRKEPAVAILCGWDVDDTPGVGTYYDFFNRLIDGKFRKECEHYSRPHKLNAKHSFSRILNNEKPDNEKDKQTADNVVKELLANANTPRQEGINKLLQDMLSLVSLKPSIQNGTISNPDKLNAMGDGSYMFCSSNGDGKKTCECKDDNSCSHPRSYSTPDAEWGFYPSKKLYYFGYHPYSLTTTNHKNKILPLFNSMQPANSSDYVLSVKAIDEFLKSVKENNLPINIYSITHDKGSNAIADFQYYANKGIKTAIPLDDTDKKQIQINGITFNENGIPFCKAGLLMRHHCFSKTKNRHIFNCPVKRPSHSKDNHIFIHHIDECPLKVLCDNSKMGPTISVDRSINIKFYPEISRDSSLFKNLQDKLHHAEAMHDSAKNDYKLNQSGRSHRKGDYNLIRYYAVSIVLHAKAWLPDDDNVVKNNAINFVFNR